MSTRLFTCGIRRGKKLKYKSTNIKVNIKEDKIFLKGYGLVLRLNKFSKIFIISSILLSVLIPTLITATNFTRVWTHNLDNYINDVEMSSDGRYLVVGTYDNLIMFDTIEDNLLWDKDGENLHIRSLSMSSDGKFFVACLNTPSLNISANYFESANSTPLWTFRTFKIPEFKKSVSMSSDGKHIAAIYTSPTLIVFEKSNSIPLWNFTANRQISALEMAPLGNYVVTADLDGKIYFLNNSINPTIRSLWNYTTGSEVRAVAISNDNKYIAVGSNDNTVYLFDKLNSTSKNPLWNFTTQGNIISVDFSIDEKYLVVASGDDKLYLFETSSSIPVWTYLASSDIFSAAISDDGKYVTAGGADENIYLLRGDNGLLVSRYKIKGESSSIRISSNGDFIACAGHYYDTSISEYRIYLYDRSDLAFVKDLFFVSSILLQNLLISGLPTSIIVVSAMYGLEYYLKQRSIKRKELEKRLEEERFVSKLDSQFEAWDEEDKKK